MKRPYNRAQVAIAELKSATLDVLGGDVEGDGMLIEDVGRILGLYLPHLEDPTQVTNAILALLKYEGLATCNAETKHWLCC